MAKLDIAAALQKFTGETERNKALTAINSSLMAALGLDAAAVEGKADADIAALVKAKISPVQSGVDLPAALAAAKISIGAGQSAEQALAAHAAAHATLLATHADFVSAVGVPINSLAGKTREEVKGIVAARVAARSAEQLSAAGFSPEALKETPGEDAPGGQKPAAGKKEELTGSDRVKAAMVSQLKADPSLLVGQGRKRHQNVAGQPNLNN
jgi:hypothetical protein